MSETAEIVVSDCEDMVLGRELLAEYLEATIRETGLPTPSSFDAVFAAMRAELDRLPGPYAPPGGALLVARAGDAPVGSVGIARLEPATAELKRLWIRPRFRRGGVARVLTVAVLERAGSLGCKRVVLDVLPSRTGAIGLYRSLGFDEIEPYNDYPFPVVAFERAV